MNNSRVDKYSDDKKMSRVTRNEELYKEIKDSELDGYNIRSNATVIGNQEPEIDIEKIKKILDTKYNEAPKRKSIRVEPKHEENSIIDDVPTKEYDLNIILEKAKDEKPETYEEARDKKLRNTQYDILNNLNIGDNDEDYSIENNIEKPEINKAEEDLMELINTITINEAKVKEEAIKNKKDEVDLKTSIFIGLAQGLAALPGFSRSGWTIATGLFCGLDRITAARYSFLLSIPIILGASMVYPLVKIDIHEALTYNWEAIIAGTLVSAVVGYICIKYFMKFISKFSLAIFGYYCIITGLATAVFFAVYG